MRGAEEGDTMAIPHRMASILVTPLLVPVTPSADAERADERQFFDGNGVNTNILEWQLFPH